MNAASSFAVRRRERTLEQKGRDSPLLRSVLKITAPILRWLYRSSGGKMGGNWANDRMPVLRLTTTRRRTGKERTWPVSYIRDGDAYVVVASNGGLAAHPPWYYNLTAEPYVVIEVGGSRRVQPPQRVKSAPGCGPGSSGATRTSTNTRRVLRASCPW
jgi:deazaflavin-dependent oxidoreductase (nitroreductase family)